MVGSSKMGEFHLARWFTGRKGQKGRASLEEQSLKPLKAASSNNRTPAAVGNGPNCDHRFGFGIDDDKGEFPEQEFSCIVHSGWLAFRCFPDCVNGPIQLINKVKSYFRLRPIPGHSAPDIRNSALMILNGLTTHSPRPGVRDAVVPMARSRLFPLSYPRFYGQLPHPTLPVRIHSHLQDCRGACWLTQSAHLPGGQGLV